MYVASLKSSENYKAQPYKYASPSKQILKAKEKPFPPCTHYRFNDHRPDDYQNNPECEICGSYDHFTSGHNRVILRHIKEPIWMVKNQNDVKVKQIRTDNGTEFRNSKLESFCYEKGISHNFSSPYTPEQNGVAERKNITLIQASRIMLNDSVPEVVTLNVQNTPHIEDVEGPPDLVTTKGTQGQVVEDEQIICQPTEATSGNNSENSIEPKKVSKALKHPGWVDAMQEELNQFYRNKVWTLVSLPYGKTACGSKWVFRNKKDELGTVKRNKARLVAQGSIQEEGIDYDETFVPVARIEAIGIFLAFVTYTNFKVFQIELEKALYRLKQASRAWYETLSTFPIQNKFVRGKIDNTLFIFKPKEMSYLFKCMWMASYLAQQATNFDDKGISIYQEKYTRDLQKKYEISDSSLVKTPMVPPNNLGPDLSAKKQQSVAMSSPEAEYVADARNHILKGDNELHFIPTEYQLADIFTKPLDEPTFTRLKAKLGMLNID
ncbi:retrovirus-related pol polyprotein from transposon TNT 1-94 [Tanacetum coccineum]